MKKADVTTARAVQYDHHGDRTVLQVRDIEVPAPTAGRVTVRVRAAGINPGEAGLRRGDMAERYPSTFPSGQGSDLAGVIEAVGDGVEQFEVGDEVLGFSWERSSQAELVGVPADHLTRKPAGLPWPVAGALPGVGVTAYAAVRSVGLSEGEVVVISAAAGGVGTLAVQLARRQGAIVIGIASRSNHPWLEAHGVLPVAYDDGLADRIRALAPGPVVAFIDLFGPEYVDLALELGVPVDRVDTIIAFDRAAEVGARTEGSADASTPAVMAELAALVVAGDLELPIAATYPLDRVQDAYAELEARHTRGKIVLLPQVSPCSRS